MALSKHVPQVRSGYILRCADGSVPAPPFDLCIAHAERCSFRDATGILRTPQKEQPVHYYLNISCIQAVATDFVVPHDVLPLLGQVHKELLCLVLDSFTWYCLYFNVMCFATTDPKVHTY